MTKQVFIIQYRSHSDVWGDSFSTSGYFDSKEDAETYLKFHGYEWDTRFNRYTHQIHSDNPRIVEIEKVDMNLTRPEVDTFLYEQLSGGVKADVSYIGSLAQISIGEFEIGDIIVNKTKFIESYSSKEFFSIEKALILAEKIKNKVNPNLGDFTVQLSFEDEYENEHDFRWRVLFTDSDGDVITWLDTKYYSEDSIDIFVNVIEEHLRDNLPLNPQISPMSRKQVLNTAYEEATKVFGVDPAYYGAEGEEEVNRQLEKLGYKVEDFKNKEE